MGTRTCITFTDSDSSHSVYQHYDGYPSNVADNLHHTIRNAWPLPRFEADEFAAAYVATCKEQAGNVRLSKGPRSHGDLSYRYTVRCEAGAILVDVVNVSSKKTLKRLPIEALGRVEI
jgi:hypothetical protein